MLALQPLKIRLVGRQCDRDGVQGPGADLIPIHLASGQEGRQGPHRLRPERAQHRKLHRAGQNRDPGAAHVHGAGHQQRCGLGALRGVRRVRSHDVLAQRLDEFRGRRVLRARVHPGECLFNQSYGGDSTFSATLSRDTLSLASDAIPNFAFGCINSVSGKSVPPQGLLGLGRGPMSLLAQSGSLYAGVFSYCLPSFKSYYFSGSLKLGPLGQPSSIKYTPLLKNPHRPSLYYVNLTGVTIGKVLVPLPQQLLAFDPLTGAGTIIDSGTVITRFVEHVYAAIRDEFRAQVKGPFSSLGAFDTCFAATHEDLAPAVKFHFTNLDLTLPVENTLIHSSAGSLACLAMAAAPNNVNSVVNVIANLQQQNLRIVFDVANSRLGISRELCN
uniref:Peptidase A1 domain-containing protein n=1 Tax=Kalanchoe fedtschenkoi TaxID=63787 RepID=A0A7N0V021_KALFE